jgi:hypothetical protein
MKMKILILGAIKKLIFAFLIQKTFDTSKKKVGIKQIIVGSTNTYQIFISPKLTKILSRSQNIGNKQGTAIQIHSYHIKLFFYVL